MVSLGKSLVSIIIPVYNREIIVKRAIDSALAQSYKNIEIICVDNCSTDNTWNVLKQYALQDKRIKIFRNKENLGPVRNWKKGLEIASGTYIKYLWSDDSIEPTFIEKTAEILDAYKDIGLVYTRTKIILETKNTTRELYSLPAKGKYPASFFIKSQAQQNFFNCPVSPGCALFRKKIVDKYLYVNFDNPLGLDFSKYGAGNDVMLFYGTLSEYKYFYYLNETLSTFYGGLDSITVAHNNLKPYYDYVLYIFLKSERHKYWIIWNLYLFYLKSDNSYPYVMQEKQPSLFLLYLLYKIYFRLRRFTKRLIKHILYRLHLRN